MKSWLIQSCFVLFSLFFSHETCAALSQSPCPHDQSLALIQLNNSFSIDCISSWVCFAPEAKTVSWKKGTDCCLWDGVTCDVKTGNVIGLDLSCSCLVGHVPSNSTLFSLRHLRQLNLAWNDFSMSPMVSQFSQLTGLTHLNISGTGFTGKIPLELSYLSELSSLDLSNRYYGHNLIFEGHVFENVVRNLTQLRHLLLSGVDMSSVEPTSFLNVSSYITTLILEDNGLQGKFPEDVFHFPYLEEFCLDNWGGQELEVKFPKTNWSGPLKSLQVFSYMQELPDSIGNLRSLEILHLYSSLTGPIPATLGNLTQIKNIDISGNNLSGLLPISIFNLTQVESLDFSMNNVIGSLPSRVSGLSRLLWLGLGENFLSGRVPSWLFSLPSLKELWLCNNRLTGPIEQFDKVVYSQLEVVHLSYNEIQGPIPASFSQLMNLTDLDLSSNTLSGRVPSWLFFLPSLEELRLGNNRLTGPIEQFDKVVYSQLEVVHLSYNKIQGPIPASFSQLMNLTDLDLSSNNLSGRVPSLLFSLPSLKQLSLGNNRLTGPIEQFDKVVYSQLEVVDLSNNEIQGPIPASFSLLVNLTNLGLSSNNLSGTFDMDKLSNLNKLEVLSFSNNALLSFTSASNADYSLPSLRELNLSCGNTSEFPNFVRNLQGLITLDLSYNRIRVIRADMFLKLICLETLVLSHNSPLSLSNNKNLSLVLPHLSSLLLSSCNITEFSNFLTTQEGLTSLDLSNNIIQGLITKQETNWGTNLNVDLSDNLLTVVEYSSWKNIKVIKLGSNLLEGPLLPPPPSASVLLISENRLTGEIPPSICNLNYSKMDVVLDLSRNNLSGAIPRCLGLRNISVLDLQKNHLHGNIPDFCAEENYRLQTLNLNNNDFDGPLPKSLANCHHLEVLNLGNNKINDTFPHWLGTLPLLQVLVLRANYFHGQIIHLENGSRFSTLRILDLSYNEFSGFLPTTYFKSFQGMMSLANVQMRYMEGEYYRDSMVVTMKGVDIELERILTIFATLDMSSNRFEGTIPETIGNLVSLQVLNFSHNHLTGHIPSSLGNVAALESLDLSCNKLVGEIPSRLVGLNFLEALNLSENHLVGLIPRGNQFNTFLNDSYFGNPGLCGFPVSKSCGHSEPPAPGFDEHDGDSAFSLDWKFVMMGYGCGMVFGFSAGYIMMTIRKPKWLVGMVQRAGSTVLRRFKRYH